jgi:diacylglycerol kinase
VKDRKCSTPENICVEDGKNHKYDAKNYWESQSFAIQGLRHIIRNERNFRIQFAIAVGVVVIGLLLGISYDDWISLFLLITLVLISEAFNSVIEAVCDTISQEYRINIKYAKDAAAGAVFISATVSAISGILILGPYIWDIVSSLGLF